MIPSRKNKSVEFINDFSKTLRRTNFLLQVAIQAISSQRSMVSYSFIVNKTETLFSDFLYKRNVYFWYFQSDTKNGDIFTLKTSLDMKHFWVKSG